MKNTRFMITLFLLFFLGILLPAPAVAASTAAQSVVAPVSLNTVTVPAESRFPEVFPQAIFPLAKTSLELHEERITLDWSELSTTVQGAYKIVNPEEKKVKVKLGLPNITSALEIYCNEEKKESTLEPRLNAQVWELQLEAKAEINLHLIYTIENSVDEAGIMKTGYRFNPEKSAFWGNTSSPSFSLTLNFKDTHPGQILKLVPYSFQFKRNSLVWEQAANAEKKDILILASLQEEMKSWQKLLSPGEKAQLQELTALGGYKTAAEILEKKAREVKNKHDKRLLKLGQAYYLTKTNYQQKALSIFEELVDSEEAYPRAYWELGKSLAQHPGKLEDLLEKVREHEVHALLQPWLLAQLPDGERESSAPQIIIKYTDTNMNKKGITIKGHLTDPDGDIDQVTLHYHWEGERTEEMALQAQQFYYEYEPVFFVPAPSPFKRLYFEISAVDFSGNKVTTGTKEAFYLTEDFQSETFVLDGANLILADYTPREQNKLYAWFKSYLNIAQEVGFVPIEAKSPLFIFMGKNYDFIKDYQGVIFMQYTPAPFSPKQARIAVHRHFLSYWYGAGWNYLPEKEIAKFGDALLLGKNWYYYVFKYLQQKDYHRFAQLLCKIGEGQNWRQALMHSYGLSPLQLYLFTGWHTVGSYVLALIIIIGFAWLGKHGYITKFVRKVKNTNFSQK